MSASRCRPARCASRRGSTSTPTAISISSSPIAIAPTRCIETTPESSRTWRRRWDSADTRRTVGAVWFDFDEDGDLDVAVANMDGDANGLFRNDGAKFTDAAESAGVAWGGRAPKAAGNGTVRVCAADIDNDGRFDLFAANYGPLGFFSNRGKGTFDDRSAAWGIGIDSRYDACAFADFDHDGQPRSLRQRHGDRRRELAGLVVQEHRLGVRRCHAAIDPAVAGRSRRAVGGRRRRSRSRSRAHRRPHRRHASRDAQHAGRRRCRSRTCT